MTKVLLTMLRYQLLTMPSLFLLSCILVTLMPPAMLSYRVLTMPGPGYPQLCIADHGAADYVELSCADQAVTVWAPQETFPDEDSLHSMLLPSI